MSSARYIVRTCGGDWHGHSGNISGPGHSPKDRSVKVWDGPDGRPLFYSFAGDDWRDLQAWAEAQGFVEPWKPGQRREFRCNLRQNRNIRKVSEKEAENMRRAAWRIWQAAGPLPGSLGEAYLRDTRCIAGPFPSTIRFHPRLKHRWTGTVWPGLVCAVQGVDGKFRGIVRILIDPETADKAPVFPNKPTLGPCSGGAVRLATPEKCGKLPQKLSEVQTLSEGRDQIQSGQNDPPEFPPTRLCIGEGVESSLSAQELSGWPTWAAVTAPFMEALELPEGIKDVCLAADNDRNGRGQDAARIAAERWKAEGRAVRFAIPEHPGTDWNDELVNLKSKGKAAA